MGYKFQFVTLAGELYIPSVAMLPGAGRQAGLPACLQVPGGGLDMCATPPTRLALLALVPTACTHPPCRLPRPQLLHVRAGARLPRPRCAAHAVSAVLLLSAALLLQAMLCRYAACILRCAVPRVLRPALLCAAAHSAPLTGCHAAHLSPPLAGMAAYSELQQKEFTREKDGYTGKPAALLLCAWNGGIGGTAVAPQLHKQCRRPAPPPGAAAHPPALPPNIVSYFAPFWPLSAQELVTRGRLRPAILTLSARSSRRARCGSKEKCKGDERTPCLPRLLL